MKTSNPRKNGCSMLMWGENEIISYIISIFDCDLAQNTETWILFSDLLEFRVYQDLPIWILLHSISGHDVLDRIMENNTISNSQRLIKCKQFYLFLADFIWFEFTFFFIHCQSIFINRAFFFLSSCLLLQRYWSYLREIKSIR